MSNKSIFFLIFILPILIISIAIHEFAHCWTTDRLGDDTPRRLGRVTLNPLKHLDPMGTIMMVVSSLSGFGIGWGKASPFNPANFRKPARDRMLTAIAGPISNLLQMLCWASLGLIMEKLGKGDIAMYAMIYCIFGVMVNGALAVFNLLPIYPLDGHHILSYLVPESLRPIVDNRIWGIIFLVLVFSHALSGVIGTLQGIAVRCAYLLVGWPPPQLMHMFGM